LCCELYLVLPRLSLQFLCIGATFVEMLVHMMIAHICHGSIEPFGRTVRV
jgi:hypothetical protein